MTTRLPLPLLLFIAFALPGCISPPQQAYYASPVNGQANQYHPLPQVIDSARTAFYAEAGFYSGSANSHGKDWQNSFRSSFTVAHHTGMFQLWGGGDFTFGVFHMGEWDSTSYNTSPSQNAVPFNAPLLNDFTGRHTYGSLGFHGGANLVLPIVKGEFRVIGIEGSLNHDYGNYYDVRQKIPDTAASIIARGSNFGTMGISSEIVGSTMGGEFGFRIATGWALGRPYRGGGVYDYNASLFSKGRSYINYGYTTMTVHFTQDRFTLYGQLNFATKAPGFSFGLAYRLNKPRLAAPSLPQRKKVLLR